MSNGGGIEGTGRVYVKLCEHDIDSWFAKVTISSRDENETPVGVVQVNAGETKEWERTQLGEDYTMITESENEEGATGPTDSAGFTLADSGANCFILVMTAEEDDDDELRSMYCKRVECDDNMVPECSMA